MRLSEAEMTIRCHEDKLSAGDFYILEMAVSRCDQYQDTLPTRAPSPTKAVETPGGHWV